MNSTFYKFISNVFGVHSAFQLNSIMIVHTIEPALQELIKFIPRLKTTKHFRAEHFEGDWSGSALYSSDGKSETMKRASDCIYHPTDLLEKLPRTGKMLNELEKFGNLQRVRILKVSPGTHVKYHIDLGETARSGVARLHIPLVTNSKCKLVINGNEYQWRKGELWYGDFSQPHELWNFSKTDRFHLVIDLLLNEEGKEIFPKEYISPSIKQKIGLFVNQFICVTKNRELKGFLINKVRGV